MSFIDNLADAHDFPAGLVLRVLGMAESTYYDQRARKVAPSRRELDDAALLEQILKVPRRAQFAGTYTSRAIRYVAEGDIVVVESRGRVDTVRGEAYDNTYCCVCRFGADGLLHELTEYMDTGLADAVLVPPPRQA